MTFLNPLLLLGIGAITVPILLHLFLKRRLKRVIWGAMRFLQASVERNQKRMRIENLLLLLLRCALLILLALTLARPAFRDSGFGALTASGLDSETTVIELDNSYSMSQTDGVSSRFEKARSAAEQIVDSLPPGSSAAVFLVSDGVRAVIPEPTRDLNLVRKVIREATLSSRGTDIQLALRQGLNVLKNHSGGRKAIYLVTDGQASGWTHFAETRAMLQAAGPEVQTRVILTGSPEKRNAGVSDLRLASALSPAKQSLRFEVEITNYGAEEMKNVPVSLTIDDAEPCDEGAFESLAPGASKSVSLFARISDPGYHTVTARLAPDHLPADDQRTVAVRVFEQARVLLVDGKPGREPRESEVFFLRNALVPVAPEQQSEYFIKTETISPSDLESVKLGDFEAVVLANVVDFSEAARVGLEKYVRHGGGLMIFPGDKINVPFYNGKLDILPAKFGQVHGEPGDEASDLANSKFFKVKEKDYQHPMVSIWKDPAAGTLATAHFYRAFELKPESGKEEPQTPQSEKRKPAVVIRYEDGTPAIMERNCGLGTVIQFSSTAGTAWNDLPVHPVFVPLIHRALGLMVNRQNEQLNIRAGEKFMHLFDSALVGKEVTVIKPLAGAHKRNGYESAPMGSTGGKPVSHSPTPEPGGNADRGKETRAGKINLMDGEPGFQFDDTDLAGVYPLTAAGDPPVMLKFAVQPNAQESKLEDLAQIETLAPAAQVLRWSPGLSVRDWIEHERSGTEIWLALAILALLTACAESVLAARYSRSK